MLLRLNWCDPGVWKFISCRWVFHEEVVSVIDVGTNKSHVVDAIFVKTLTWICQSYDMDLSNLLHGFVQVVHGFVKVMTWVYQICLTDLDLLKQNYEIVNAVTLIC